MREPNPEHLRAETLRLDQGGLRAREMLPLSRLGMAPFAKLLIGAARATNSCSTSPMRNGIPRFVPIAPHMKQGATLAEAAAVIKRARWRPRLGRDRPLS